MSQFQSFIHSYKSEFIECELNLNNVLNIVLNRAENKNAFNEKMILDLLLLFKTINHFDELNELRLIILSGKGNVFCSGADLNYMKDLASKEFDANYNDALKLGDMFYECAQLRVPVISAVKGAAIGGGFGLCVCSDYVLCDENAIFATSEVRLGLIPAVISPYIIRKMGVCTASPLMLSGMRIDAQQALDAKLINKIVTKDNFEEELKNITNEFLRAQPLSAQLTKELIKRAYPLPDETLRTWTASQIAQARALPGAKEGLECFFQKKKPHWSPD